MPGYCCMDVATTSEILGHDVSGTDMRSDVCGKDAPSLVSLTYSFNLAILKI